MHSATLKWITPNAEAEIVECARVSSDPDLPKQSDERLLAYLIRNGHWSPFEMANLCIEANSSRRIQRQMLRHWSMRPQEFSQRYQDVRVLGGPIRSEARLQHPKNRQQSLDHAPQELVDWWNDVQDEVWDLVMKRYGEALERKMAKEQAADILPEGLTPSKVYYNAPIRSVIHFIKARQRSAGAQKEINLIANDVGLIMAEQMPIIYRAAFGETS